MSMKNKLAKSARGFAAYKVASSGVLGLVALTAGRWLWQRMQEQRRDDAVTHHSAFDSSQLERRRRVG